jgi:hypothetical protein
MCRSVKAAETPAFEDARTDVETNDDEREAEDERHQPAPDQELISGEGALPSTARFARNILPDTELRPRRDESNAGRPRPFHRQQHRAAPLAANTDGTNRSTVRRTAPHTPMRW